MAVNKEVKVKMEKTPENKNAWAKIEHRKAKRER